MHKNIALLIKKMVDESPYDHFRCEVVPKQTGGFWECIIRFTHRDDAHSTALVKSLEHIGQVYGETLFVEDRGSLVEVS